MRKKFVIWGAGTRGENLRLLLKKERVAAFIDNDLSKVGKRKKGVEIIDFATYCKCYEDLFIIIAVVDYKEIESFLIEKGIYQYFVLSECPSEFKGYGICELERLLEFSYDKRKDNIIVGSNLFSYLLYEKMYDDGCERLFCYPNEFRAPQTIWKMEELLNVKMIRDFGRTVQKASEVFVTTRETKGMNVIEGKEVKGINAYDFSHKIKEYYNPSLERFKNVHSNQRCFIVATGPSLDKRQIDILRDNKEICFGMNRIYNLECESWMPDYYVAVDKLFIKSCGKKISEYSAKIKFINGTVDKAWEREGVYNIHCVADDTFEVPPTFSEDIAHVVYGGATVAYVCIQIAVYMGFSEIYLLGVDCNYCKGSNYNYFFYEKEADEMDHKEDRMILSYESAKKYADLHGIRIYNATGGGRLEVFERVDFDSLFE